MSEPIKKLVNNPSFIAWAVGEADKVTAAYWDEWINKNPANCHNAQIAQQIITELEVQPADVPGNQKFAAWEQLDNRIVIGDDQSTAVIHKLPTRHKSKPWFYSMAAAAAILILVMSVVGYRSYVQALQQDKISSQQPEKITVSTDFGEHKLIELSDGSQITLNANSSITYHDGWIYDRKVRVELNGEAFFDVAERISDKDPAFRVSTVDGDIRVLGTRFVVSTRKEQTRVVLEKGEVEINPTGNQNDGVQLKPNDMAEFGSKGINIRQVNTWIYTSWTKHLLVFDQTSLTEVTHRIEQTFGVRVKVTDRSLKQRKLSGAVESKNLEVLTSALAKTLETTVSTKGDQIIIGGKNPKIDTKQ